MAAHFVKQNTKNCGGGKARVRLQPSKTLKLYIGGEGGIRTPDRVASITVFETAAFNHSATSPELKVNLLLIIFNLYRNIYSVFVFNLYFKNLK